MTYLMDAPDEVIRWEARSHQKIYDEVWTEEHAPLLPLVETLPMWRRIDADLGEIRSRYEVVHQRVLDASAGADADAGHAAAGLVTRALAEAQELAGRAGARRAMLSELHGQLRRAMPQPRPPAEDAGGFLLGGHAWLSAPDFHGDDAARRNDEEWARELMRRYERDITVDQLGRSAVSDAGHAPAGFAGTEDREHTVPLGPAPARVAVVARPTGPDLDAAADPPTEPVAVAPAPRPAGSSYPDFGPTGACGADVGTDTGGDTHGDSHGDTATAHDARGGQAMAGGVGRPPESYLEEVAGPVRSATTNPFAVDIRLVPPVLGE